MNNIIESKDHKVEPNTETKKIYKDFISWFKPLLLDSITQVITVDDTSQIPDSILYKATDLIVDYGFSSDEAFQELIDEAAFCWFIRLVSWQFLKNKGFTDKGFFETCYFLHPYIDLFQAPGDYTEEVFEVTEEVYQRLSELPLDNINHIGYIYQFYNADIKDAYYNDSKKKGKKAETTKDVVAATGIYTPYWIIRYMEENSLGRLWINHKKGLDPDINEKEEAEAFGWSYYLETGEQPENVVQELDKINKGFKELEPAKIKFLEPCMGTGLMLLSAFDIFLQIYQDSGIKPKEAAQVILEKNLFGADIDLKAWRIAKFSLIVHAAEFDPGILTRKVSLHLTAPVINGRDVNQQKLIWFGTDIEGYERMKALMMIQWLCEDFDVVKKMGSLMIPRTGLDIDLMRKYINSPEDISGLEPTQFQINNLLDLFEIISDTYDVCCTNPPYLGSKHYDSDMKNFFNSGHIVIPPELDPWEDVYQPMILQDLNSKLIGNKKK